MLGEAYSLESILLGHPFLLALKLVADLVVVHNGWKEPSLLLPLFAILGAPLLRFLST